MTLLTLLPIAGVMQQATSGDGGLDAAHTSGATLHGAHQLDGGSFFGKTVVGAERRARSAIFANGRA
jgi:hypothetical protein